MEQLGGASSLEGMYHWVWVLRSYCPASLPAFSLLSVCASRCDCPVSCFSSRTIINPPSGTASQNELFFSTSYLRSGCFTTAVEKQWTILMHPQTGFLSGSLYVWVVSSLFFFFLNKFEIRSCSLVPCLHVGTRTPPKSLLGV